MTFSTLPKQLFPVYKAVAFDMDGLMFDTEDVYDKSATELLARRGCLYTREIHDAIMGRTPQHCFNYYIERFGFPETWQELKEESDEIFLEKLRQGYSTMPGLLELLDALEERHIAKGICTSSAPRVVNAVLERDHLGERFQFILTSDDIVCGKPDPEVYLKAADKFAISPEEMLVLEDSQAGCNAARNANAACFVILAPHNRDMEFPRATKILSSLADPQILAHLPYPLPDSASSPPFVS